MKTKLSFFFASLLFVLVIYLSAFNPKDAEPIQFARESYRQGLEECLDAIGNLKDQAAKFENNQKDIEALRASLIESRNSFKRIEFLAEKLDHDYVKDYINGAPLPSLEKKVPSPTRLDPAGLQILDELIFAEEVFENKSEIASLSSDLYNDFNRFVKLQKQIQFYDHIVFEGIRAEIIRIFTLSITGFDTPASGNALNESIESLKSMKRFLENYEVFINNASNGLGTKILQSMQSSIEFVEENNDFDTFDRLTFYRDYLRPLNQLILEAHRLSGLEMPFEVSEHIKSTNYLSKDFFSEDYFNPYFYTKLTKQEDSPELLELGKTLFYDPILSANNERSCASCHNPQLAFTDGKKKSLAKDFNGTVDRNSPTLINSVYADRYFHDMRAYNLEVLLEHVVTNRKEFSLGLSQLENKLKKSTEYQELFNEAFDGSNYKGISSHAITAALTSFIKSLNTFNSDFDKYVRAESTLLDERAKRGFNLFMGKAACGTCHFAPVFNGTVPPGFKESESEILGVPEFNDPENMHIDPDIGRFAGISKEQIDFYKFSFKTPTVRNIALTGPYMHNGVYETLEEVMDFYNKGGGEGLGYEVPNQTLPFDNLNLSDSEQQDIIAFMNTLTDTSGTTVLPKSLPKFENNPGWNERKIGGVY